MPGKLIEGPFPHRPLGIWIPPDGKEFYLTRYKDLKGLECMGPRPIEVLEYPIKELQQVLKDMKLL